MSEVAGVNVPNVTAWFERNIDGASAPFTFDLIAGGHSNLTYRVTGGDGMRYVLRRPPLGHVLASAHDMGREHRLIAALQGTAVPVAPALGYCDDPEVNGAPFYVMGFVDGLVIRDVEAAQALSADARRRAGASLIEKMAAIHSVDLQAVGLADLARHEGYIARQLKRWYGQWGAQKTRELPSIDRVYEGLLARIPDQGPATLVHGDYRLDNCMVDTAGEVVAVLDWEICTLGDPLADVGQLMFYWTGPTDEPSPWLSGPSTAEGFPDRGELADMYGAITGRDLTHLDFYVAFACWKLACILEGVYARYLGGAMGETTDAELARFKLQVDTAAAKADELVEKMA